MTRRTADHGAVTGDALDGGAADESARDEEAMAEDAPEEAAMREGEMTEELARIRERAGAIRDEAVAQACSQLRARGELSQERRAAVEALANRLVEELLAVPARGFAVANEREEVAETVTELFAE